MSRRSSFAYIGEYSSRLVSIATGVVAPTSANADCAIALGEEIATRMTGMNYADAKLWRNDKVMSIGAATNSATVRSHDVEVDPAGHVCDKEAVRDGGSPQIRIQQAATSTAW